MGRLQLFGIAWTAALALSAFTAASASAVTFLLAEWLVNGAAVTTELSTGTTGELLLEDQKTFIGAVAVLCSAILNGWVGASSLDWVSGILTLAGESVNTIPLSAPGLECVAQKGCESSSKPLVWAVHLGWESEVELMEEGTETFFVDLTLPHPSGSNPGWEVECLALGIAFVDECTASESINELVLSGAELLAKSSRAFTELALVKLANCTLGGSESGVVEGEGALALVGGGELGVSSGPEPATTSLTTSLSGEGKEGAILTVVEGSKVKDNATLSGKNASTATGKVTYDVYSNKECTTLVTAAGEVTVSGGSVPASSEETLTAGASYYWQAHYSGDSNNKESTSPCTEISNIIAKTSLSTALSSEGKEGETLTVLEGSKIDDKATLSGTNSSTATGQVVYKIYTDNKCKTLLKEAGEVTLEAGGKIPPSSEQTLEGGASYYWQATYKGDSLHQESTSTCGKEISTVKAATSLNTSLSNGEQKGEKVEANEELAVSDTAALSGTHSSDATGTVKYNIYSDIECKILVTKVGEVTVSNGSVPPSLAETLPAGTYYWQAIYSGDSFHQGSTSVCGTEISVFKASTQIATSLSGEGQSSAKVEVVEGSAVNDTATLAGPNASKATGAVKYAVYSDNECKTPVTSAGEVTVTSGSIPPSNEETLPAGTYYWQATYSGDANNEGSTSACGEETAVVGTSTSLSTSLSGGGHSGAAISVVEGTEITDQATLSGTNASKATGDVGYTVYSDKECKTQVAEAGEVTVTNGGVPASSELKLSPGTYYWQASYSGDGTNHRSVSSCGGEIVVVMAATSLDTTLSGGGQSREEISVLEGAVITDQASLSGANASKATGTVKYAVYSDKECKTQVAEAGEVTVTNGSTPPSNEETLPAGTYYWQATYSGDANNAESTSVCGVEASIVKTTLLTTSLSGEGHSGERIQVMDGAVHDTASLSGANASKATGTVKYAVYSDKECKTQVAEAGEVTVTNGSTPPSNEETLPAGTYYWQATYSGDASNEGSTTPCGQEIATVGPTPPKAEQVTFVNDMPVIIDDQHGGSPEAPEAIEEFTGHNKVEWEYTSASKELVKSWPVAYVQGTTPELKARFALPTSAKQLILEKRLEGKPVITGQTTLAGESITFTREFASIEELETQVHEHEGYIEIGESLSESPIKASKPLPEMVGYESMAIKWTWTIKVKGESSPVTQGLGSSTLNLFLTYSEPPVPPCRTVAEAESAAEEVTGEERTGACTPMYLTMLALITTEVQQIRPSERTIINGAWNAFAGFRHTMPPEDPWRIATPPSLVPIAHSAQYDPRTGVWINVPWWTHNGRWVWGYKYYEPVLPGRTAAEPVNPRGGCFARYVELFTLHIGRCGVWAEVFVAALRAVGGMNVSAETIGLVVNLGANNRPCNENQWRTCIMLVQNWNVRSGLPNNQIMSGDPEFPVRASALQDTLGVAGQGNENPPPYFWDHAIVKAGRGRSAALYDPSYGTGPFPTPTELNEIERMTRQQPTQGAVLLQYQNASIAGFCRPTALTPPNQSGNLPNRCARGSERGLGLGAIRYNDVLRLTEPRPAWWP